VRLVTTCSPSKPGVARDLVHQFGAQVVASTSAAADFAYLTRATRLVICESTFSWWAAALSNATEIHAPGVGEVPVAWDDPRYVFHDISRRRHFGTFRDGKIRYEGDDDDVDEDPSGPPSSKKKRRRRSDSGGDPPPADSASSSSSSGSSSSTSGGALLATNGSAPAVASEDDSSDGAQRLARRRNRTAARGFSPRHTAAVERLGSSWDAEMLPPVRLRRHHRPRGPRDGASS